MSQFMVLVPSLWPYDDAPRVPVPATTTEPGHALRGNTPTTTSPVTPPISPSTRRLSPLVSPGRYSVTIRMAATADLTVITAPPSSKTATDIVSATTRATWHGPVPIAAITRSPTPTPSAPPTA